MKGNGGSPGGAESRRFRRAGKPFLPPGWTGALPVLLFPLAWYAAARILDTPLLPDPLRVLRRLASGSGWPGHLAASLGRIGLALLLALGAGFPLGILAAGRNRLSRSISLLGNLGHPIPKAVLLPPLVLLLGVGEASKVLLLFLVLFFPILTAVRDAAGSLPEAWFLSLSSLGIPRHRLFPGIQTLRHLLIPALAPAVLTSLRITLGVAVAVLFFTENFGTVRGMGQFITDARIRVNYPDLYGGILVLSLTVLGLYLLLDGLEKLLSPWKRPR